VLESFPYEEASTTLEPGDTLVMYSDGIPDANDEIGNFFGEERLLECIRAHAGLDAPGLMQHIIDDVCAHEQGASRTDDLTIVVVKRAMA
jgi:sigma-B regulation protein RsbU (phosphoserine phosphatase)